MIQQGGLGNINVLNIMRGQQAGGQDPRRMQAQQSMQQQSQGGILQGLAQVLQALKPPKI